MQNYQTAPLTRDARVVFVQTGDFRGADQRIRDGIGETYHAQKYSMSVVERLVPKTALAAVICVRTPDPYDEVLPSGVRAIGMKGIWQLARPFDAVNAQLEALGATHLVLRLPDSPCVHWARRNQVRVLPCLADSFAPRWNLRGLRARLRLFQLARAYNHPSVEYIGNHNLAASRSLTRIGVAPEKIVPWDWPRTPTPDDFPAKDSPKPGAKHLVTVGSISEAKGTSDVIRALAADPGMGDGATLDVVGPGEIDAMRALATSLGVADRVTFTGRVGHAEVGPRMHAADAVLVYSRKGYGEGLPGTIYAGLASRTPMVLSDHPMFTAYLQDGEDVLFAPDQDPNALAGRLRNLFDDPDLYARISQNSAAAFERIKHPVLWGEFVERWLHNTPQDRAWLQQNALPHWTDPAAGKN